MAEIYSWVKNIIIFLVLTTIISNLLGKSNYKKYVNLITGIILVLFVISPLLKLFQLEDSLDYFLSSNLLVTDAEDLNGKLIDMEEGQMSAILKDYKEEIGAQVSELLEGQELFIAKITIEVEEDEKSEVFGTIKSMDISASYLRQDIKQNSSEIDKIEIDKIEIGDKKESTAGIEEDYLSPSEINIKNLLSDFYNMNPDNINISIQE